MKKYISLFLTAAVLLSVSGCAESSALTVNSTEDRASSYAEAVKGASDGAPTTTAVAGGALADVAGDYEYAAEDGFIGEFAADISGSVMEAPSFAADDCIIAPEPETDAPDIQPQAGLLTGGEWNDNLHWNDWISLYQTHEEWNDYRSLWEITAENRCEISVTANGEPVEGAKVSANAEGITAAVTDNRGKAYLFFENADTTGEITVQYGGNEYSQPFDKAAGSIDFELSDTDIKSSKALDLMLMIDTTGSMWDELAYLQAELEDVITQVKNDNGNIPVRVSVNFYRDEYDDYIIREFEFTEDINSVIDTIRAQNAEGGGDTPEAVHTALASAVKEHEWNDNATKLMFFVLDAPPHDDSQIIGQVNSLVSDAAEEGIRIIPVASSGIDKSTEYLLRTMAFSTGGTYTFLTNDSGIGGDHIEPTIGEYEVEKLNVMMVRIINSYLE